MKSRDKDNLMWHQNLTYNRVTIGMRRQKKKCDIYNGSKAEIQSQSGHHMGQGRWFPGPGMVCQGLLGAAGPGLAARASSSSKGSQVRAAAKTVPVPGFGHLPVDDDRPRLGQDFVPWVGVRIQSSEGNQGQTQPRMARQGHGDRAG